MPTDEPGGNHFIQGYKDIWNMGTDLGNEFPDGDLLSDVLLRSTGKTDFQNHFQREENFIKSWKIWIRWNGKYGGRKICHHILNICCFLHDCMLFCEHTVNLTNSHFILGALIEQYSR